MKKALSEAALCKENQQYLEVFLFKKIGWRLVATMLSMLLATMTVPIPAWAATSESVRLAMSKITAALSLSDYDISWYVDDRGEDEYFVTTANQLRGLAELVNGTAQYGGETIAAIDFSHATLYLTQSVSLGGESGKEFTPIGSPENPFAGTFNAGGNTISGLFVQGRSAYAGLFGYVAEEGVLQGIKLAGGAGTGIKIETNTDIVECVGSLVGKTKGMVEDCSSDVAVTVSNAVQVTEEKPYAVHDIGGLIGYACADIERCSYSGELNARIYSDAVEIDTVSKLPRIADSFGGLVGHFGNPSQCGTLRNSYNLGNVMVQTYGAGAEDRLGAKTYACAFFVGGIAGFSHGSILDCYNGAYNTNTQVVTGKIFTGVYKDEVLQSDGTVAEENQVPTNLMGNRGAYQTGGIVGGLCFASGGTNTTNTTSATSTTNTTNTTSTTNTTNTTSATNQSNPDNFVVVKNCYNEAQVTGLAATGGIVGLSGEYCTITQCYNGTITDLTDWKRNQVAGKIVSTRWNMPMTGGILGQCYSSNITYCANYAEVRNIQTGYYMAGIAGCVFASSCYPSVTGEMHSCFNSGGIYTVNASSSIDYREAGICGQNEGYIHDCIVMQGTVPYHNDSAIGDKTWGAYSNLVVRTSEQLRSPQSAALLNTVAVQSNVWDCYWFINGSGYPVLNTWASNDQRIELTSDLIGSVEQLTAAPYIGLTASAIPTLKVTLKSGKILVQNTDFRVIPEQSAYVISTGMPYHASIEGIGMYKGVVSNCGRYDIGKGDFSLTTVQISSMKYRPKRVTFPTNVRVSMQGNIIDAAEYDFVIYNASTSASAVNEKKNAFAVFDSLGYISYDSAGNYKYPVSQQTPTALNDEQQEWWLWDRNQNLISDSAGNSYYTSGENAGKAYGVNTSCVNPKSGSPAGYVIKIQARDDSVTFDGHTIGYYLIEPLDLYRECDVISATCQGQTWLWDKDTSKFYTSKGEGETRNYNAYATFTGQPIEPKVTIAYQGQTLEKDVDYRIDCRDPDPANGGTMSGDTDFANRNVTSGEEAERAAIVAIPANKNTMTNFIIAYFNIAPASFKDCEISLASDEWAYTGKAIEPEVIVSLNGVALCEGVDYEVAYTNNVSKGEGSFEVRPLANLSADSMEPRAGTFKIVDGIDLSGFALGNVTDQQFNWNYDVHQTLTFHKPDGSAVALTEGEDYVVSYSTNHITRWSEASRISPCTVTVKGVGRYTGSLEATFDIIPYDANANTTKQLTAFVQKSMVYGTWGHPPIGMTKVNGKELPVAEFSSFGSDYPVMWVQARPIINWAAYDAAVKAGLSGDELLQSGCYGDAIMMGMSNDNNNGGLVNRYAVRYYAYNGESDVQPDVQPDGSEVNGNGAIYIDSNNNVVAQPELAQPGIYHAKAELRCGTSGSKGGATGWLDCGIFEYAAPASISTVNWTALAKHAGSDIEVQVIGTTQSGIKLMQGADADYTVSISYLSTAVPPAVEFTVSAVEGAGKLFKGSYSGLVNAEILDLSTNGAISGLANKVYTGENIKPEPIVTAQGKTLRPNIDYMLSFFRDGKPTTDFTNVGTIEVHAIGIGYCEGACTSSYTIAPRRLSEVSAVLSSTRLPYKGSAVVPLLTARFGSQKLRPGIDYTLSYVRDGKLASNLVKPGLVTVRMMASVSGNYIGTQDLSYTITRAISGAAITLSSKTFTYDGKPKKPSVESVKIGSEIVVPSLYSIAYLSASKKIMNTSTDAGTYYVQVAGKNPYTNSILAQYTIAKATNKLKVKVAKNKLAAKSGRKTTLSASRVFKTIRNVSKGKLSFKKKNGNARISVLNTGKVTVKKGLKKGRTYSVKVQVASKETMNYKSATTEVTLKVLII